ncbi:uncharacterized protein LOC128732317 [Sabethes cyaneus]|uniref:uncharacterized protein LOC128732317 n=1 Tax=Sabethes cyaneus TaxID=53552 RepID=UPI00237D6056|nr:uncharacterized protein LOC128732317 [Sabethes cyaneus]
MLLLALRSFFFVAVILGYSTGVWRLINDYFRRGFKDFLAEEVKRNQHLLVDPADGGKSANEPPLPVALPVGDPKPSSGSVTANRLLDELIVSFGRLFTAATPTSHNERGDFSKGPDRKHKVKTSTLPGPGGTPPATTDIEGKQRPNKGDNKIWSTSSSSTPAAVAPVGGPTGAEDDNNEEDKWLNYWRRKQFGDKLKQVEPDGGHCEALPADDVGGDAATGGCHP